jgi:predicted nucleic acid-binding protein
MTAYFDSGVLTKLYCMEADSQKAASIVEHYDPPYPFTHWQEIEIRNALRLKGFRKELTEREIEESLALIREDIKTGVLKRPPYDLEEVFKMAEILSAEYAFVTGCRTLDILHVAVARTIGVGEFCSFDVRQRQLAVKAGLHIVDF